MGIPNSALGANIQAAGLDEGGFATKRSVPKKIFAPIRSKAPTKRRCFMPRAFIPNLALVIRRFLFPSCLQHNHVRCWWPTPPLP